MGNVRGIPVAPFRIQMCVRAVCVVRTGSGTSELIRSVFRRAQVDVVTEIVLGAYRGALKERIGSSG